MTEAEEWENDTTPRSLVERLLGYVGLARKRRLLLCACCRHFPTTDLHEWVEIAERFSDGVATQDDRQRANTAARNHPGYRAHQIGSILLNRATLRDASHANLSGSVHLLYRTGSMTPVFLCLLIRDIFGNPFRPVAFDPSLHTETAVALARGMYESRDFGAMPILADALQDAGCDSADVLDHCRDAKQVHVRGCWVVDLVLGKS